MELRRSRIGQFVSSDAFLLVTLLAASPSFLKAQGPVPAAQFHPPGERANSAAMQSIQIPSHGALLNAFLYLAAGANPHPVVILLHGLPGNERNLDLAQSIRRAGWNVLYMDYRGSWGSPGDFSFSHSIEDVAATVSYLREPSVSSRLRLDSQRVVLIGHSMGGFLAVQAASNDASILAVGLISPVDFGGMIPDPLPKDQEPMVLKGVAMGIKNQGLAPLTGCTPEGLAQDIADHSKQWNFSLRAVTLRNRPVLLLSADDGWAQSNEQFAEQLKTSGSQRLTERHFATDHSYSDQREAMSSEVLSWLKTLAPAGN